ncbi:hypothetical protein [Chryseobacterium herbae]|uniref:VCBS repeat-containing protein n=1 Tax=Chryseobacterium herbae TaxID=2976476 RepID=A0ABT2ITC6_9FLAO|nr:hypothetical protein [Chryseobacterium sp. pc1-10]MCT2562086.1 hypothetical protein [Chryseobacterium sp. pc1-10]
MKKTILIFLPLLMTISCKDKKQETKNKVAHPQEQVQSNKKSADLKQDPVEEPKEAISILLPKEYRDFGKENEVNGLAKDWLDLYQKNGKFYLGKADYTVTREYSECSGDSTKVINSKNNSLLLIGHSRLTSGEIKTVKIVKNKIWPKEKLKFHFGNEEYTLRAEGKVLSSEKVQTDEGEELYQNVKDYKLYLSANNAQETLFLEEESFNYTFVELLFIGDIDKDGKPDFIFGANRDYEEERVILYLSSQAKKGKLIKKAAEVAIQFDC